MAVAAAAAAGMTAGEVVAAMTAEGATVATRAAGATTAAAAAAAVAVSVLARLCVATIGADAMTGVGGITTGAGATKQLSQYSATRARQALACAWKRCRQACLS